MRYFVSKRIPPFTSVLLIESGNRELFEELLRGLYDVHPGMHADLVTCYGGVPSTFRNDAGQVYRVTDYPDRRAPQTSLRGARRQSLHRRRHDLLWPSPS